MFKISRETWTLGKIYSSLLCKMDKYITDNFDTDIWEPFHSPSSSPLLSIHTA